MSKKSAVADGLGLFEDLQHTVSAATKGKSLLVQDGKGKSTKYNMDDSVLKTSIVKKMVDVCVFYTPDCGNQVVCDSHKPSWWQDQYNNIAASLVVNLRNIAVEKVMEKNTSDSLGRLYDTSQKASFLEKVKGFVAEASESLSEMPAEHQNIIGETGLGVMAPSIQQMFPVFECLSPEEFRDVLANHPKFDLRKSDQVNKAREFVLESLMRKSIDKASQLQHDELPDLYKPQSLDQEINPELLEKGLEDLTVKDGVRANPSKLDAISEEEEKSDEEAQTHVVMRRKKPEQLTLPRESSAMMSGRQVSAFISEQFAFLQTRNSTRERDGKHKSLAIFSGDNLQEVSEEHERFF